MKKVEMYTKSTCPFCHRAKALLEAKSIPFSEFSLTDDPSLRDTMIERSGRTTVPQVFIDNESIGGCDDLQALDAAGKLDALLK